MFHMCFQLYSHGILGVGIYTFLYTLIVGNDQHLIIAISDANDAPSCHLGSSFACLAPPGRIGMKCSRCPNSTSCLRYCLPACNSYAMRPSTTNLIPQHQSPRVFHEKRQGWDVSKVLRISCALPTHSSSLLRVCIFTHRHLNGAIRWCSSTGVSSITNSTVGIDSRTARLRARIAGS